MNEIVLNREGGWTLIVQPYPQDHIRLVDAAPEQLQADFPAAEIRQPRFHALQVVRVKPWALQGLHDITGMVTALFIPTQPHEPFVYRVQAYGASFLVAEDALEEAP